MSVAVHHLASHALHVSCHEMCTLSHGHTWSDSSMMIDLWSSAQLSSILRVSVSHSVSTSSLQCAQASPFKMCLSSWNLRIPFQVMSPAPAPAAPAAPAAAVVPAEASTSLTSSNLPQCLCIKKSVEVPSAKTTHNSDLSPPFS